MEFIYLSSSAQFNETSDAAKTAFPPTPDCLPLPLTQRPIPRLVRIRFAINDTRCTTLVARSNQGISNVDREFGSPFLKFTAFALTDRSLDLQGAPAGFEQMLTKCSWSKTDNGARVAAGGGDRTVTIWEVETGKILYKLSGHKGSVGGVDFHPKEPISECWMLPS